MNGTVDEPSVRFLAVDGAQGELIFMAEGDRYSRIKRFNIQIPGELFMEAIKDRAVNMRAYGTANIFRLYDTIKQPHNIDIIMHCYSLVPSLRDISYIILIILFR